jgi:RsiW-degrading membrane proteinase PrsW (M82 family)
MTRRIALLTTMLALAIAVPASAQTDAFGPLPSADTPVPTVTATATADDGSTSKKILFLIGGALIIGFGVMGYFIMRDARAAIPEEDLVPRLRDEGVHKHKKQAKAKARAKTRSQKRARKVQRNR